MITSRIHFTGTVCVYLMSLCGSGSFWLLGAPVQEFWVKEKVETIVDVCPQGVGLCVMMAARKLVKCELDSSGFARLCWCVKVVPGTGEKMKSITPQQYETGVYNSGELS